MVKLLNVSYSYNGSVGVNGITLEIVPGELVLLIGRTGAGKTTLIRLISLELFPDSGEIILGRFRTTELRGGQFPSWRRRIGVVFQDLRLLKDRTALENVRLAACCERCLQSGSKARALRSLASVGLSHKLHGFPDELSAGEQQRTAIARALVNEPFVLLADEPVSNLDRETAADIVALLQKVNQGGTAVLVATHQPERFENCRSRLLCLDQGRLVER